MALETLHKDVTEETIIDGYQRSTFGLDNVGFCLDCGMENSGCEPDMEGGDCEGCGESRVFGCGSLLEMFL